jgi:hypothetical protein
LIDQGIEIGFLGTDRDPDGIFVLISPSLMVKLHGTKNRAAPVSKKKPRTFKKEATSPSKQKPRTVKKEVTSSSKQKPRTVKKEATDGITLNVLTFNVGKSVFKKEDTCSLAREISQRQISFCALQECPQKTFNLLLKNLGESYNGLRSQCSTIIWNLNVATKRFERRSLPRAHL